MIELIFIILGAIFGSFAGAQVWRLRAKQLSDDKTLGYDYDKKELKKLTPLLKSHAKTDRSRCLNCGHVLGWIDLIPLVSWLSTGGKCRYCKHRIGNFEPLIEVAGATLFGVSAWKLLPGIVSPLDIAQLTLWIIACVLMLILLAYDAKWFLLPDSINFAFIGISILYALTYLYEQHFALSSIISLGGALLFLTGLYGTLYYLSKGQWIGFGDVKLSIGLALFVGTWQLGFLTLFLANLIGTLAVLPALMTSKIGRKAQIPFGPFLILGMIIAVLFGNDIIRYYDQMTSTIF